MSRLPVVRSGVKKHLKEPTAIERQMRICFGVAWFETEEEALQMEAFNRELGMRVVGGFEHGLLCGREPSFDKVGKDGKKLYACRY